MNLEKFEKSLMPIPESGCWIYEPNMGHFGYGRVWNKELKRAQDSHRYYWEKKKGPIPNGLFVLHKCDVSACCNLDHLYLGTQKENINDAYRRKRRTIQNPLECKRGHPRNKENTYIYPNGEKTCRICVKLSRNKTGATHGN